MRIRPLVSLFSKTVHWFVVLFVSRVARTSLDALPCLFGKARHSKDAYIWAAQARPGRKQACAAKAAICPNSSVTLP
jgi:hypothetical protein